MIFEKSFSHSVMSYWLSCNPPTWARTRDLILKRDLLYQLSYGRAPLLYNTNSVKITPAWMREISNPTARWQHCAVRRSKDSDAGQ